MAPFAARPAMRFALGLAAFVLAGVGIAIAVLPPGPFVADPKAPPLRLVVAGQELAATPENDAKALEAVRRYAAAPLTLVFGAGEKRSIARGALGAEIDRVRLAKLLADARDPTSPMRRALGRVEAPIIVPLPVFANAATALSALLQLKDSVDRSPADARFDLETKKLLAEQPGRWLDVYESLARVEVAFAEGRAEVELATQSKAPRISASQMGDVEYAEVMGWFETRYAADKKHEARTYNLRLAASKLDGHVILPGETFDFNDVVGPRDEANGYKVAPVIAQGELVDGIGGGTCQIAGTLHGAAFFSGLEIVERHPHTRPSFYIKMGLDATVVYPTITLRLRNGFGHPVVLHETVRDGTVRAEILGPKRVRTVTFVRKIDEVVPFPETERLDPKLPKNARVLVQRGIPGFKIHRYRVVRQGAFGVRERWQDTYPPTSQIIRLGTGEDPESREVEVPADDPHPEYVADEYLVLLQGLEVKSPKATGPEPGGGMVEVREAGKTGEYGWTERAGFSHWNRGKHAREGDEACPSGDCGPGAAKSIESTGKGDAPPTPGEKPKKKRKKR